MSIGVELPPPPPVVSLPTVIAENNIRFIVKNYNTSIVRFSQCGIIQLAIIIMQFTDKVLKDFEIIATHVIFIGIWINGFDLFSPIPYRSPDRFA